MSGFDLPAWWSAPQPPATYEPEDFDFSDLGVLAAAHANEEVEWEFVDDPKPGIADDGLPLIDLDEAREDIQNLLGLVIEAAEVLNEYREGLIEDEG